MRRLPQTSRNDDRPESGSNKILLILPKFIGLGLLIYVIDFTIFTIDLEGGVRLWIFIGFLTNFLKVNFNLNESYKISLYTTFQSYKK